VKNEYESAKTESSMKLIKSLSCRGLGIIFPSLNQVVEAASDYGFQAVDLPIMELWQSGEDPSSIREIMESHGLVPGASPLPLFWRGTEWEFQENMESKFEPLIHFAREIGLTRLYTRVNESLQQGESFQDALDWHCQRLSRLLTVIQGSGLRLGLETVGVSSFRQGRPAFLSTLKSVRNNLAELFDSYDHLGLLVDLFHLHAANETLEEAIGPFTERIVGVHMADLPRPLQRSEIIDDQRGFPETSGLVPIAKNLSQLADMGVDAPVMVETVRDCFDHQNLEFHQKIQYLASTVSKVWPDTTG
jgi:sugar phosphate isomerase/epimerase